MPNDDSDFDKLERALEQTDLPATLDGLQLLPVSHNQFHANWSLSPSLLKRGQMASAASEEETHLVLRTFNLSGDADRPEVHSNSWSDFAVSGIDGSGYFSVEGSIPQISASLGLINRGGRFTPLLSGEPIHMIGAPKLTESEPTPEIESEEAENEEEDKRPTGSDGSTLLPQEADEDASKADSSQIEEITRPSDREILSEAEISARLEKIVGLPKSLTAIPARPPASTEPTIQDAPATSDIAPKGGFQLDEEEILANVRQRLAEDLEPNFTESREHPESEAQRVQKTEPKSEKPPTDAPQTLASQWSDLWSDNAPVSIRAVFVLTGQIKQGMSLLLGGEIIQPNPGGRFVWKHELNHFNQAWSLIEAALYTPTVPAGPSLEFFAERAPGSRMLDMQASLEISGMVSDHSYREKLPEALKVGPDGSFKTSCFMPYGAVILPGLALVAD